MDLALYYGNTREARSTVPYGSFDAVFSLGDGRDSNRNSRRLFGTPFGGHYQFNVLQTFDFIMNPAYDYGGQGVDLEVGMTRQIFSDTTLWMAGAGGVTMLGAVNTLAPPPPDGSEAPRARTTTARDSGGAASSRCRVKRNRTLRLPIRATTWRWSTARGRITCCSGCTWMPECQ